jgi:protein required for attachment to host cells
MGTTFDNILGKLKSVLFEGQTPAATAAPSASQVTSAPVAPSTSNTAPSSAMVQKVHELLDKVNMPGIDFMELWDATNAMGAVNQQNVSNAFVALKIASGNALTKQHVLSTGEQYARQLQAAIDEDIAQKQRSKQELLQQAQSLLASLTQETESLAQQIAELQTTLESKRKELVAVQAADNPTIKEIDKKIADGSTAVQAVIAELSNMLNIAQAAIKD